MSDQMEIFGLLDVDEGTIAITDIQISTWGREVLIECRYQAESAQSFQILFEDCRSIEWDVLGQPDDRDGEAEALGIFLGQENYHASAIIATDIFELAVQYGRFSLLKNW